MRIAALKSVLSIIAVSTVTMLGAGPAAATNVCSEVTFHLSYSGGNFVLVESAPGTGTAKFVDSPVLSRAGGNPYHEIETWEGYFGTSGPSTNVCILHSFSPLHVWLGLRNSDDQGTNFDLKAEVFLDDSPTPVVTAERLCIKGLTRNPALAQEIIQLFPQNIIINPGIGVEVSLKLSARIGTPTSTCGGHASAIGLRLYYDSADRDSQFDINFVPGT